MQETSKSNQMRGPEFFATYLSGSVLDIGCGDSPVVPHATPFDREQGDANDILSFIPPRSFDCVYSSHCLEHMRDPAKSIRDWWVIVKPGGHLITVVPHEDLYEQRNWPSPFNSDHKWTFRVGGEQSWSPVSHDLRKLVSELDGAELRSCTVQDEGYDHTLTAKGQETPNGAVVRIMISLLLNRFLAKGLYTADIGREAQRMIAEYGGVVDQTKLGALAQIEIIARKAA